MDTTLQGRIRVTTETRWKGMADATGSESRAERVASIIGPELELADLRTTHVQTLVEELLRREYAPATVNRHLAALSAVLTDAKADGVKVGPYRILRQPEPEGRLRWLSPEEVEELAAGVDRKRPEWGDLVRFLADTGLRPMEALRLQWKDCGADRVSVWKTKTGKPRTVPLTRKAARILERLGAREGGPWFGDCLRSIQRAVQAGKWGTSLSGDREVTLYTLRHSAATRLVEAGVHIRTVGEWLGHSSVRTTQRYAHVSDTLLEDARDALEAKDAARMRKDGNA